MLQKEPKITSIIMAGGKGSRMGNPNLHKCLFEINNQPSIHYLVNTLNNNGVDSNIFIVGVMADQLMHNLSQKYNNISYVFQPEQKGTGNAAKWGIQFLRSIGFEGLILIVAGDSFIEDEVVQTLIKNYKENKFDLGLMAKKKVDSPTSGRIVIENEKVLASIEYWDIMKAQAIQKLQDIWVLLPSESKGSINPKLSKVWIQMQAELENSIPNKKKLLQIFPKLSQFLQQLPADHHEIESFNAHLYSFIDSIQINGVKFDPFQLENNSHFVNVSVYAFHSNSIYEHIDEIDSNNAQNEEYLTDIVSIFANHNLKIQMLPVNTANQIMSFNTPEELEDIRNHLQKDSDTQVSHRVSTWIQKFKEEDEKLMDMLTEIYGSESTQLEQKISQYLEILNEYGKYFSFEDKVIIIRAPGRLNLMGRHIDHRGGDVNMIAINRELILVSSSRDDDKIVAFNHDNNNYPQVEFSIGDILASFQWNEWLDLISNKKVIEMIRNSQGDWGNYLKAAALRLQVSKPNLRLKGVNAVFMGNIPQAAGLSSSSALVVSSLDALLYSNNISLQVKDFIDLCGEGEWFVGTRGGSADHAAIKVSNRNQITQLGFFDFKIKDFAYLPDAYEILIINSMKKAEKSNQLLIQYNSKILAYEIGLEIIRQQNPRIKDSLHHLRDLLSSSLNLSNQELLSIVGNIPSEINSKVLPNLLNDDFLTKLGSKFHDLSPFKSIPIRGVIIYGLGEIKRSKLALSHLKKGEIVEFGKLMNISHNGDRVAKYNSFDKSLNAEKFEELYDDSVMESYIHQNIPIEFLSGSYECSIPEIDFIVDFLNAQQGVLGAQISGAGMGGCVMALVEKEKSQTIKNLISDAYLDHWNILPEIIISHPIKGASILSLSTKKVDHHD